MSIKDSITLNQIAQRTHRIDGDEWFSNISTQYKKDILRKLSHMIIESHPSADIVQRAIRESGLKPTFTPCVLLSKGDIRLQLAKIVNLPSDEYARAFRLLISLFRLADNERRSIYCHSGCDHWWHLDLEKPEVVQHVMDMYEQGKL